MAEGWKSVFRDGCKFVGEGDAIVRVETTIRVSASILSQVRNF